MQINPINFYDYKKKLCSKSDHGDFVTKFDSESEQ